ncbi:uncharacterized protein LOC122820305 [Gambusia affinis]|uniref:uncharacterized protein LOC122820305 n=1 Tax=Gambusia affinis TaxID=33528 RepID=UPI001CDCBF3A|nr:uncharacterized protein LOC122820305 [Gambusia affinis]
MLVNHSSSNTSVPALPSDNSSFSVFFQCLMTTPSSFIFIGIDINIIILMLPLSVFILHHGVQQWLQRRSTSTAAISHSDCFTYHMVAMEILGVFGYSLNLAGILRGDVYIIRIGDFFTSLTWFGQIFFHVLTCLERHLAVVHPIVYLRLKNERGIRIRNVGIGCAWMLSAAGMSVMMMTTFFYIWDFCILLSSLAVLILCSVSVLRVLIRPGPGEPGEGREAAAQLKQRAFCMISTILGVLVVRFAWNFVWEIIFMRGSQSDCVLLAVCVWFNVPSSLVLPLLFLHRAGMFVGCGNEKQSGKEKLIK